MYINADYTCKKSLKLPNACSMNYLNKIKVEAKKRNIPLSKLADSIQIPETVMKRALKRDELSINQLRIICDELNMNVSDLFAPERPNGVSLGHNLHFLSNKVFC